MKMSPKVVVFDFVAASVGGQLPRAEALLARIRTYDPDSAIFILRQPGTLEFCDSRADLTVIEVSGGGSVMKRLIWRQFSLTKLLHRLKADVFISFSNLHSDRTSARTILGVLNLAPFSEAAASAEPGFRARFRLRLLRRLVLQAARKASSVFALSETARQALCANGIEWGKVSVIPNGISDDVGVMGVEEAKAVLGAAWPGENYILYVSHFYSYKNMERLLDAYAALPKDLRSRHNLVIAGRIMDSAYHQRVMERARELGVDQQLTVLPGVSHRAISALHAGASVFAFPSLVENCPNALLEAMRCGTPIACSNQPSMPEFAEDGAEYFDGFDARAMSDALYRLLSDQPHASMISAKAQALSKRYTWDRFAHDLVALYRNPARGLS